MKNILLANGEKVIVDDRDFGFLSRWLWHKTSRYASRNQGGKKIYMHRLIANTPMGMDTDHINGNGLDNRRSNLRVVTTLDNMANILHHKGNKSGVIGVSFYKRSKQWVAKIMKSGKQYHLGYFNNIDKAKMAYQSAKMGII